MFDDVFIVDGALLLATARAGTGAYDFSFRDFLPCRSVTAPVDPSMRAVMRIGAIDSYPTSAKAIGGYGARPANSIGDHDRAAQLSGWYPALRGRTPRSIVFDEIPSAEEVEREFGWPVFVKGDRQTSRHSCARSIIPSPERFRELVDRVWRDDAILRWQKMAVREFIPLRSVRGGPPGEIPRSFEFRAFTWDGEIVGLGRYWTDAEPYRLETDQEEPCRRLILEAARLIGVPFLAVDVAMTKQGEWIVVEVNDAQESGHAGIEPISLWQAIVDRERGDRGRP